MKRRNILTIIWRVIELVIGIGRENDWWDEKKQGNMDDAFRPAEPKDDKPY